MTPPAVHAKQLGRRYGKRWALARVDLEVPAGERLLIVGANGSGKTTLLRTLSTALSPSMGELRIFGRDALKDTVAVRASLGLLSHLPQVYRDLSGAENLRVFNRLLGITEPVEPALERVGLPLRPEPVRTYSAGMIKRLSFARLLSQKPRLALIDEPYGQLDPAGFAFVDELLQALTDQGTTVIVASHQVDRARLLCDRAILLDQGQIRWEGAAPDVAKAWGVLHG
ncbi:MAG: ABC transporter ATP-binding protein [Myxococcota bacterium]|nr:ABC transporter ATP-binding protein [Myxococcota bacterium]